MAYHITLFDNASSQEGVTINPHAERDNYVLPPKTPVFPNYPVLLNAPPNGVQPPDFQHALVFANFIYTGTLDYAFWDSGGSQIFAYTQQQPTLLQILYGGSAGNLTLIIQPEGKISFVSMSADAKERVPTEETVAGD